MMPTHIPSQNSSTVRTLSLLAIGLTIAVGIVSLIHLRNQMKLVKIELDKHENDGTAHKKSQA